MNTRPAFRVVPEPVEARARRRQQHDAVGPRRLVPASTASLIDAASITGTTSASASRTSGAASPIATTARPRDASGSRSSRKSPPLNRPPTSATTPTGKAFDRPARRFDVRRLRVVDEADAADRDPRLHHMLETAEALAARHHRARADAGNGCGRDCCDDVVQHVPAGQLHRRHGNQALRRCRRATDDPVAIDEKPSLVDPSGEKPTRLLAMPSLCAITIGSSALTTAQSSARWFAKMRAFAAAYASTFGCRSRWSSARLSHSAIHGLNVVVVSSWKLLTSTTWMVSGVESSTCDVSGTPMLPPTSTSLAVRRNHPSKQRRRRRLPFRSRHRDHATAQPSRCELELADDFHSARASRDQTRLVWRHSRTRDDEVGSVEGRGAVAAELELDARVPQRRRLLEVLASFSQQHPRPSPEKQFRRCNAASRRSDNHHSPPANRKVAICHAITAASTS